MTGSTNAAGIHLDKTHWPLAVATLEGRPTADDLESFLRGLDDIHSKGERFFMLTHMRVYRPDMSQVTRMGAWAKNNQERTRRWCAGSAIVLGSPTMRFVISAFYLIAVPPCPMTLFDDPMGARSWLRQKMGEEKMPIPEYLLYASP